MPTCSVCGRPHAAGQPCPKAEEADRTGQVIGGKYKVVRHIGEGGMAAVYEARHVEIQRPFALKFLHPWLTGDEEWLERFRREAAAGGALISEHIAAIVDIGVTPDDAPYIVMEFLVGEDLGQRLSRECTLKPQEAIELVIQTCSGLSVAHAAGVVHRDLKPENLFLAERELGGTTVKILDFGIAKLRAAHLAQVTRRGMVIGTPFYMSPEQAGGRWDVDHRTDIYALGVILFELLSGDKPFVGENHTALLNQIIGGPPPSLKERCPTISDELSRVVQQAMATSARERFQTAAEFAEALCAFAPQGRRSSRTASGFGSRASWRALSAPSMTVAEPNLTVRLQGSRARSASLGAAPNELDFAAREAAGRDAHAEHGASPLSSGHSLGSSLGSTAESDFDDATFVDQPMLDAQYESEEPRPRLRSMAGVHVSPAHDPRAELDSNDQRPDRTPLPLAVHSVGLGRTLLPLAAGLFAIVLLVAFLGQRSSVEAEAGNDRGHTERAPAVSPSTAPPIPVSVPNVGLALATAVATSEAAPSATAIGAASASASPTVEAPGWLSVTSYPTAELLIGGKSRGQTPIVGLRLDPGEYQLVLVEPTRGRRNKTVRVQSQRLTSIAVHFDDQAPIPPAPSASSAPVAPPAPVKNCSPRFYLDSDGVRRVKPECLF